MEIFKSISNELYSSLINGDSSENITSKWKEFSRHINNCQNYDNIPNVLEVSKALYQYTYKYTNKNEDEEKARCFLAFCALKLSCEQTLGKDNVESLIRLSLLISRKIKYLLPVFHYTFPKEISNYEPANIPTLSSDLLEQLIRNIDSIKIYLLNKINDQICKFEIDIPLAEAYSNYSISLLDRIKRAPYDIRTLNDGCLLLDRCYNRLYDYGKYQLYIYDKNNNDFFEKSRGLIFSNFNFNTTYSVLTEGDLNSTGNLDAWFSFILDKDNLVIHTHGIKEEYIKPYLNLKITDVFVEKLENIIDFRIDYKPSRGDGPNMPFSIDIVTLCNKVDQIRFCFCIGDDKPFRYLTFKGNSFWIQTS